MTNNIDGDGAGLAHGDIEFKVFVDPCKGLLNDALCIGDLYAGHQNGADFRDRDQTIAVNNCLVVDVNRSPGPDEQLVPGAQNIVRAHRCIDKGCKGVVSLNGALRDVRVEK